MIAAVRFVIIVSRLGHRPRALSDTADNDHGVVDRDAFRDADRDAGRNAYSWRNASTT